MEFANKWRKKGCVSLCCVCINAERLMPHNKIVRSNKYTSGCILRSIIHILYMFWQSWAFQLTFKDY
jgi:hypothetical protein